MHVKFLATIIFIITVVTASLLSSSSGIQTCTANEDLNEIGKKPSATRGAGSFGKCFSLDSDLIQSYLFILKILQPYQRVLVGALCIKSLLDHYQ